MNIAVINSKSVKRSESGKSIFTIFLGVMPREKRAIISLLSESLEKRLIIAAKKVSGSVIKIISGITKL